MAKWTAKDVEKLTGKRTSKPKKTTVKVKKTPKGLKHIMSVLDANGIKYVTEHRFHPVRKWRFDIAIIDKKIAVEYEGLMSSKSRHTTITGYVKDCEKYNNAQILGWCVFRYTAMNYKDIESDFQKLCEK